MTELQRFLAALIRSRSTVSQAALAEAVGMSEKHLSQMLTGKVEGSLTAWQTLLDVAGVRLTPPGASRGGDAR